MNYNSVQVTKKRFFSLAFGFTIFLVFLSPAKKRRREFRGRVCSKWCAIQHVAFVRLVIALRRGKLLIVKTEESGFLGKAKVVNEALDFPPPP